MTSKDTRPRYWWYVFPALALLAGIWLVANSLFAGGAASMPSAQAAASLAAGPHSEGIASGGTQKSSDTNTPVPGKGGDNPLLTPTATFCAATTPLDEGFESGTLNTFASSVATCVPGGCGWASVTTAAHTGTRSAFAPDPANITDQRLTTINSIAIPASATGAVLSFWQRRALENTYDGGVLEVSTNGGTSWLTPTFAMGGYTGTISTAFGNPLAGRQAWTGSTGTVFTQTVANLLPYAGQSVTFRFREGTDNSVSATGWWIDDVTVTIGGSCSTPTRTATPCSDFTILGSITNSDAVQTGRLNRSLTSSCGSTNQCPGAQDTLPRHYDSYTLVNDTGSTQCIQITIDMTGCAAGNGVSGAAFLDSMVYDPPAGGGPAFNPNDLCTNYLGDNGVTTGSVINYSLNVLADQIITIVINEIQPNQGCASYNLTVNGCLTLQSCSVAFQDVPSGSTYHQFVSCLACRGIINGYSDSTFRPNNNVTRGQVAKIVSGAANFNEDPGAQAFEDVAPGSPFYQWVNRLHNRGYMDGYQCGLLPTEPCVPPLDLPYFRPNANASRGQISKIVSNAANFSDPAGSQMFEDVPPGSTFYLWIQRLSALGIINGYVCNQVPTEPCVPPLNRPYFRPNNQVTRGQTAKIVGNTFFPGCGSP